MLESPQNGGFRLIFVAGDVHIRRRRDLQFLYVYSILEIQACTGGRLNDCISRNRDTDTNMHP